MTHFLVAIVDEKSLEETAKALGLSSLLPAVYNDLLSPAAKELGGGLQTVAKAVTMCLAPVAATVWGYERIREWLSVRVTSLLAERHAENIQSPPLSVAGPLVMQMVFASEEPDLREMYAKLLATAMDSATAPDAHPSFVSLIQQLTPDEAKLLSHIALLDKDQPFDRTHRYDVSSGERFDPVDLEEAMHQVCIDAGVKFPERSQVYVQNLIRLRILTYNTSTVARYISESRGLRWRDPGVANTDIEWIELSPYGHALLQACVVDKTA